MMMSLLSLGPSIVRVFSFKTLTIRPFTKASRFLHQSEEEWEEQDRRRELMNEVSRNGC